MCKPIKEYLQIELGNASEGPLAEGRFQIVLEFVLVGFLGGVTPGTYLPDSGRALPGCSSAELGGFYYNRRRGEHPIKLPSGFASSKSVR